MNLNFVACDLGEERGRVVLGSLYKNHLTLSEIHRFANRPIENRGSFLWDISQLYQDTLVGLRDVGASDEPIVSLSCNSWAGDYLLFQSDESYIPPTFHHDDPRSATGAKTVLTRAPREAIYSETGVCNTTNSTLFQLAAENSRRIKRAGYLMPIADGFNFLFSGAPCIEESAACATQLYNPIARGWSEPLSNLLGLPLQLLPTVVPAGTPLKPLRSDITAATGLENPQVVATCSNELAASLTGLPASEDEKWVFLRLGKKAQFGTELPDPICNESSRSLGLSNTLGYRGATLFHMETAGLWLLDECRRHWTGSERGLVDGTIAHMSASAEPFESLINLDDPRFATPGNMPLKIREFCRETDQPEPRKPGAAIRCVLESLALHYRKMLDEMSMLTGRRYTHLYLLGDSSNQLLNHFIANALELRTVIVPPDITVIGNIIVQAITMGHIKNLDEARQIVRESFRMETIMPRSAAWPSAYYRFLELTANPAKAA